MGTEKTTRYFCDRCKKVTKHGSTGSGFMKSDDKTDRLWMIKIGDDHMGILFQEWCENCIRAVFIGIYVNRDGGLAL